MRIDHTLNHDALAKKWAPWSDTRSKMTRTTTPDGTNAPRAQNRSHSAPSLLHLGHTIMLVAIFLSVAPLTIKDPTLLAMGILGMAFYGVESVGASYDLIRGFRA